MQHILEAVSDLFRRLSGAIVFQRRLELVALNCLPRSKQQLRGLLDLVEQFPTSVDLPAAGVLLPLTLKLLACRRAVTQLFDVEQRRQLQHYASVQLLQGGNLNGSREIDLAKLSAEENVVSHEERRRSHGPSKSKGCRITLRSGQVDNTDGRTSGQVEGTAEPRRIQLLGARSGIHGHELVSDLACKPSLCVCRDVRNRTKPSPAQYVLASRLFLPEAEGQQVEQSNRVLAIQLFKHIRRPPRAFVDALCKLDVAGTVHRSTAPMICLPPLGLGGGSGGRSLRIRSALSISSAFRSRTASLTSCSMAT
eukprot:scaffold556_cov221-Pinguiococcus_pyrenoidosus.AAC.14